MVSLCFQVLQTAFSSSGALSGGVAKQEAVEIAHSGPNRPFDVMRVEQPRNLVELRGAKLYCGLPTITGRIHKTYRGNIGNIVRCKAVASLYVYEV